MAKQYLKIFFSNMMKFITYFYCKFFKNSKEYIETSKLTECMFIIIINRYNNLLLVIFSK